MWHIQTIDYYSVLKKNEVFIHATIQMNLGNIILNGTSQTQKDKYCKISFTGNI